ncbi:hypothetical protein [Baileyella intestinalis]|nr:hypothetical protein [Baileyella intestinalis]
MYPSLRSHEIEALSRCYGMKVWQSYLENNKNGAYDRIKLSGL